MYGLTAREKEVVRWLAEGKDVVEIAMILGLSHNTIEKHRTSVYEKLDIHKASILTRWAVENGIVDSSKNIKPLDVDLLIQRITNVVLDTFHGTAKL
jgi:DNA-binding CsgD family transcriptional regulator